MVAYIHEPAVHLHNRWQQAAAGDATWRTLPFILVPAACLLNWFSGTGCFLGGKFHTHAHMHTYTHSPQGQRQRLSHSYIEIWEKGKQWQAT